MPDLLLEGKKVFLLRVVDDDGLVEREREMVEQEEVSFDWRHRWP